MSDLRKHLKPQDIAWFEHVANLSELTVDDLLGPVTPKTTGPSPTRTSTAYAMAGLAVLGLAACVIVTGVCQIYTDVGVWFIVSGVFLSLAALLLCLKASVIEQNLACEELLANYPSNH